MDLSIAGAIRAIASEANAPQALKKTLCVAEKRLRARTAFVAVYEPASARLNVTVTRGRSDPRVKAVLPGEGPVGRAYAAKTIVQEDGLVAVPMLAEGNAVGVLVALGGPVLREPLPAAEREVLAAIAQTAGMAVALAQIRELADRRGRDLRLIGERLEDRDRLRDAVLSHLSHELRTPLTTIKLYLDMLQS